MDIGLQTELAAQKDPKNSRRGNLFGFYWSTFELFHEFKIYDLEVFKGKKVLDFGCGSKLRTSIFKGAELYGIDPLANEFKEQVEWSDLNILKECYSVPGEIHVKQLTGRMNVVISINAIDHGSDWRKSIANMHDYLVPIGMFYLFVDVDKVYSPNDKIHKTVKIFDLLECVESKFNILQKLTSPGFSKAISKISIQAVKK